MYKFCQVDSASGENADDVEEKHKKNTKKTELKNFYFNVLIKDVMQLYGNTLCQVQDFQDVSSCLPWNAI